MSEAAAWLSGRAATAPPALLARMHAALGVATDPAQQPVPDRLAAAALVCLRDAMESCDERAAALPLLAADALITAACEAAAEDGPDALQRICDAYSTAALAARVTLP